MRAITCHHKRVARLVSLQTSPRPAQEVAVGMRAPALRSPSCKGSSCRARASPSACKGSTSIVCRDAGPPPNRPCWSAPGARPQQLPEAVGARLGASHFRGRHDACGPCEFLLCLLAFLARESCGCEFHSLRMIHGPPSLAYGPLPLFCNHLGPALLAMRGAQRLLPRQPAWVLSGRWRRCW